MVLDAVHGVAAKFELRDRGAVGAAQIVRTHRIDAELGRGRAHCGVEAVDGAATRTGEHEAGDAVA